MCHVECINTLRAYSSYVQFSRSSVRFFHRAWNFKAISSFCNVTFMKDSKIPRFITRRVYPMFSAVLWKLEPLNRQSGKPTRNRSVVIEFFSPRSDRMSYPVSQASSPSFPFRSRRLEYRASSTRQLERASFPIFTHHPFRPDPLFPFPHLPLLTFPSLFLSLVLLFLFFFFQLPARKQGEARKADNIGQEEQWRL